MTPQAAQYMALARRSLKQAGMILGIGITDGAARYAYMAAFNAAQALLFERHRRVFKTHGGVRGEFAREVRGLMDPHQAAFLARGYEMKVAADYDGNLNDAIGPEQAEDAMCQAGKFVDAVRLCWNRPLNSDTDTSARRTRGRTQAADVATADARRLARAIAGEGGNGGGSKLQLAAKYDEECVGCLAPA